ncbi:MAG: zf-TFIIB domain-containing protein [Dehalococcoidales bacterium]|jgi:Zn-finger nucleic acid-binding protein
MICPVCKKVALIVEYDRIELDYCPSCGGVWFDAGELELLMEAAGIGDHIGYLSNVAAAPEAATSEKKRKCPICRHKMRKTYIDEDKKVLVDVCHVGDGIWFDGGEVTQLIKEIAAKSPGKAASQGVLAFVGDMLKYQETGPK